MSINLYFNKKRIVDRFSIFLDKSQTKPWMRNKQKIYFKIKILQVNEETNIHIKIYIIFKSYTLFYTSFVTHRVFKFIKQMLNSVEKLNIYNLRYKNLSIYICHSECLRISIYKYHRI